MFSIRVHPRLKPPGRAFVASLADGEVVAAEGSLAVVTSCAARGARRRVMVERQWGRYVSSARSDVMAISARQFLGSVVIGVTETHSIRRRSIGSANEASELMARAARGDVAPVRLCARSVTAKTRHMRIQPRGN